MTLVLYNKSDSLPEGWERMRLGDCIELTMGQSPGGHTYNKEGLGVPLLNGPAEFGNKFPTAVQWTSEPTKLAYEGDILFCVRGNTTGRMNVADNTYCIGRGLGSIRGKKDEADTSFVYFVLEYLKPSIYSFAIAGGSTFPNISRSGLSDFSILKPPLPEQKKIAYVLSTVQRAIDQQDRIIALETELKKALMHKLFAEGLRGEPQKETEIGLVPESWKVERIGGLDLDIGDGNYSTKYPKQADFVSEGVPFVRANNVVDGRIAWADMRFISSQLHAELTKGHLCKDDVCLVTRGNIGQVAYVTDEFINANMNAQLVRLNGKEVFDGRFLYFTLSRQASQRQFESLKTGTALKQLPIGKLKFLLLPVPDEEEQSEIANILWIVETKVGTAQRKRALLTELFQTLLHQLMTAQIRVHSLGLPQTGTKAEDG